MTPQEKLLLIEGGDKMKKVISACIDRILQFSSECEVDTYLEGLRKKEANVSSGLEEHIEKWKHSDQD